MWTGQAQENFQNPSKTPDYQVFTPVSTGQAHNEWAPSISYKVWVKSCVRLMIVFSVMGATCRCSNLVNVH